LGIRDPAAEAVFCQVINSKRIEDVISVLEDAGVVQVVGVSTPDLDNDDASDQDDSEVIATPPSTVTSPPPSTAYTPPSNASSHTGYSASHSALPILTTPPPRINLTPTTPPSEVRATPPSGYVAILDRVLRAADGSFNFPNAGETMDYVAIEAWVEQHPTFGSIFPTRSLDRDRKVGAAGELFVSSAIVFACVALIFARYTRF
jgi:hypothetical protein